MNKRNFLLLAVTLALVASDSAGAQTGHFSVRDIPLKTESYDLSLEIDYKNERISGQCRLTVSNPGGEAVDRIPLLLYRLMKVTAVKDRGGADPAFEQRVVAFEDWDKLQVNFVEIRLMNPIQSGEKRPVDISYEGYLDGYPEAMGYVKDHVDPDFTIVRMETFAYPQVGVPSWKANRQRGLQSFDYLLRVKVPDSLTVANGGSLADKTVREGFAVYTYKNLKPAWRIDAVVAKYDLLDDRENSLQVFHFPQDKEGANVAMRAMRDSQKLYETWFGRLDGTTEYTLIEVPEGYGSQSDVTGTLLTRDAFIDKARLTDLYHEIAHRWDVRALDPLPSRFESEGRAMFLQYFILEKLENKKGALEEGVEAVRRSFRKECQANPKAKNVAMIDYGKEDLTDLSYSKGMVFFYVFYKIAGEKDFLGALASFHKNYAGSGATSEDFVSHLKATLKPDLTQLLQDWIFGTKSSEYLIENIPIDEVVKKYHTQ